ncbi:MAG: succinate dehydrogenase assembly factor 2 [Rhodanobacter sp.]|nr:MAG: succinate dehydrogenase assembly factor 2 [Rhodanobacter sp.]TAM10355.1 MAG: succinate dehydrogenase assembly factor 2 [Rhodanobacter sp.]TAM34453.1 MAG: succinate dehydrogenase assembly factor 2 [Rhodanobacter sp.]
MDEACLKRIRWRLRRGTLELDAMLGDWFEHVFPGADSALQEAFDALLDEQDPLVWDWLMGHARAPRADWQVIIDDIRTRHRL